MSAVMLKDLPGMLDRIQAAPVKALPDCLPPQALMPTPVLDKFAEAARVCREIDLADAAFQATLPLWSVLVVVDGAAVKTASRAVLGSDLAEIEVQKLAHAELNGKAFEEVTVRIRRVMPDAAELALSRTNVVAA
jgi:hypothetical protein